MQGEALSEGRYYAYREKRGTAQPLLKVKLLTKVGRKGAIKVRFEDGPHPGLEEYVRTRQLVVLWSARKAFVRDEERMEWLKDHLTKGVDPAIDEAASTVLASSGEPSACTFGGLLSMPEDELERLMVRANLPGRPTDLHALAFKDRLGEVHVPLEGAVALARAFAVAEAENVLMYIQDREEELKLSGNEPGYRYRHDLLRQYMPGFALARQWAGIEREAEELQKEIGRLRGLVSRAAYELKDLGAENKARRLLRALDGR